MALSKPDATHGWTCFKIPFVIRYHDMIIIFKVMHDHCRTFEKYKTLKRCPTIQRRQLTS